MPDFAWTNTEHGFEPEPATEPVPEHAVGVISPDEPVQLDDETTFEQAVIISLNAVHDRLDAIGSQNDWLCQATEQIHGMSLWMKGTVEQLTNGLMASPMGAMLRSKMPKE
jgi:hypothetical protein